MDLSAVLSDDQMAIIGCFLALTVCGLIAMVGFHFGTVGKNAGRPTRSSSERSLPMQPSSRRPVDGNSDRRAA